MAKRRSKKRDSSNGIGAIFLLLVGVIYQAVKRAIGFVSDNKEIFIIIGSSIIIATVIIFIIKWYLHIQQRELLAEVKKKIRIESIDLQLKEYDDRIIVNSRQAFDNYSDLSYFRDKDSLENVRKKLETRKRYKNSINSFLKDNDYKARPHYAFIEKQLIDYLPLTENYRVLIEYTSPAGKSQAEKMLSITTLRINEIASHPEYLMTKGEYNKLLKQQSIEALDEKKHLFFDKVNAVIDFADNSKETLIAKSYEKKIDDIEQKLRKDAISGIQKVYRINSYEWSRLEDMISSYENQIRRIVEDDKKIGEYYDSEEFAKIKETSSLITQSQREFNEYINEKAQSITQLFGKRVVRDETQNNDVYNYIRPYKKSITPFTAEVSAAVFGSAENDPIKYVVKYFYPNKSQYRQQIDRLRVLIEELETLKEAKQILDKYKEEYNQYVQNVPEYVLEADEDGFYSRLGLTVIDEAVLNFEYRFNYTSNGGLVQRSFPVAMSEENIIQLINLLESKLSSEAFAKEQRSLMTTKLRTYIKERDNYTCCDCGNSIYKEPNLLLEIDHIKPISMGGLTKEDNLQTLCWKCNRKKGSKVISVL